MHSFHQSRGRIFFEVLCAFAIAASLTGGWMQTGASALLAAATVAALYGFVHLFDMRRPKRVEAVQPQLIEADEEPQGDLLAFTAEEQQPVAEREPEVAAPVGATEAVEPAVPQPKASPRAKAPRKANGRRPSSPKLAKVTVLAPREEAEVTELAPPAEADVTELAPPAEAVVTELAPPAEAASAEPIVLEESAPVVLAPLFEPVPFVRQQRTGFGRKSG